MGKFLPLVAAMNHAGLTDMLQIMAAVSIGTEAFVMYQFYSASRPVYSATNALVDGGMDLNQQGGLAEYVLF